jgi:hypothetical protein
MIAASVKDGEKVVDLLLSRGADVNQTSKAFSKCSVAGRILTDTYW